MKKKVSSLMIIYVHLELLNEDGFYNYVAYLLADTNGTLSR